MTNRNQRIKELLWREVAAKSPSATAGFILAAIFVFFYYFRLDEYKLLVQASSILVILTNFLRLYVAKKVTKLPETTRKSILFLKIPIWINSVAWSIIFTATAVECHYSELGFIFMLAMMVAFAATSLVTLGYDRSIFFPFQILLILPVLFISFYKGFLGDIKDAQYLGYLLIIFFFYQLKQYKNYREQILQRFGYQVDLEKSLEEVKKGQEALVQQTAKLVHASRISALGDMSGGLAHEINNSLQVIMGSDQQIQRELAKNNLQSPSLSSKFAQSIKAIQKIKAVVDGLKYFSLQMEPQAKEEVPLKEILERALNYTFELTKAHHIKFEIDEVPDVKLFCHPFQITQIFFNIIKNADDALSKVDTSKRWIRISFEFDEKCIFIRIRNSGLIIPPEEQNKLFLPFFSTKELNQGTGLSLSISRGIALDHKGDLYFDPEEEFTTFVLKLPVL